MTKLIAMEMVLIGASVLIFRSVWNTLDTMAWASGRVGLTVLLALGVLVMAWALSSIHALSASKGDKGGGG